MKRKVFFFLPVLIALLISSCQPSPKPTPSLPFEPSSTITVTLQPTKTPTSSATVMPTPTATFSLEEQYGIPVGWKLYPAERAEAYFEPELTGFAFALPESWTCHDASDRLGLPYECILDESEDRFENVYKTRLQFSNIGVVDVVPPIEELAMLNDFKQTNGHTCQEEYLTVDGLAAVIVKCSHPEFDDSLNFREDRAAYEDAVGKLPQVFMFIINGKRIEQFWVETWNNEDLDLIDGFLPFIFYGMEEQPGIEITG